MLCIMDRLGTAAAAVYKPQVTGWLLKDGGRSTGPPPLTPAQCAALHKHQCSGDPAAHYIATRKW